MLRNLVGFAVFAVVTIVAVRLLFGMLGFIFGLLGTVLWLAFWGFVFYLILKLFAPDTARRLKELITGSPA